MRRGKIFARKVEALETERASRERELSVDHTIGSRLADCRASLPRAFPKASAAFSAACFSAAHFESFERSPLASSICTVGSGALMNAVFLASTRVCASRAYALLVRNVLSRSVALLCGSRRLGAASLPVMPCRCLLKSVNDALRSAKEFESREAMLAEAGSGGAAALGSGVGVGSVSAGSGGEPPFSDGIDLKLLSIV